jgi:hypothetical protein
MSDFDHAGGVPAIMKRIKDHLYNEDTVSGKTVHEIADEARVLDEECIRPMERPFHKEGGIAILFGNLAPEGSVVKQAAVNEKMMRFEGTARCMFPIPLPGTSFRSRLMGGRPDGPSPSGNRLAPAASHRAATCCLLWTLRQTISL